VDDVTHAIGVQNAVDLDEELSRVVDTLRDAAH
jgi:hypothetical protein